MSRTFQYLFVFYSLIPFIGLSQVPVPEWVKKIGQNAWEEGTAITSDNAGNVYVTGIFEGTIDFDPGPGIYNLTAPTTFGHDIFILKLDPSGSFMWARSIGGPYDDESTAIAVDLSGNVFTTGHFTDSADFDPGPGTYYLHNNVQGEGYFISKLDQYGNFGWAKAFVQWTGEGNSIVTDPNGNVYAAGEFGSNHLFAKVNAAGNFMWTKMIAVDQLSAQNVFIAVKDQYVYCAGTYDGLNGTVDFDPGPGTYNLPCAGDDDIYILRLDTNGNFSWAYRIGGVGDESTVGMGIDANQNVYLMGAFQDIVDFNTGPGINYLTSVTGADRFIAKFDSTGNTVYAYQLGDTTGNLYVNSMAVDYAGNIAVAGALNGTMDVDPGPGVTYLTAINDDMLILRYDANSNYIWSGKLTGASYTDINAISTDQTGHLYITGFFEGTCDFDPGIPALNLTSNWNNSDIFIEKFNQTGLGMNEYSVWDDVNIYPNPTYNGNVKIDRRSSNDPVSIEVFNSLGQHLFKKEFQRDDKLQIQLPGQRGLYVLLLRTSGKQIAIKVLRD